MKIEEKRIVIREWYETELSKTGWDDFGWQFKDDRNYLEENSKWNIEIIDSDKFGNPILGIAKRFVEID